MMSEFDIHPSRRILVVVTVGGSTNSAPILEVCRVLASRGHVIEFATLSGRESFARPYPFVSKVHVIGREITAEEDEQLYLKLSVWDNRSTRSRSGYWSCKKFYDSFWTETYQRLKELVDVDPPDFIFSDFQVEAPKDIAYEYSIPMAEMWPQMPWLMAPQPWIPGLVGAQARCLTNEDGTMYDRLFEQSHMLRDAPNLIDYYLWVRKMRRSSGILTLPSMKPKPGHVVLINSFFDSEIPKDLPPLMMVAGPVLSDDWDQLNSSQSAFLQGKTSVVYLALGTHVILSPSVVEKILRGLASALNGGVIDGVVFSAREVAKKQFASFENTVISDMTVSQLIQNKHNSWLFLENAPQRALLEHRSIKLFFTHAGASSGNEALYHGVPQLCMGICGDQIPRAMRHEKAGVALSVEKHSFTAEEITDKIRTIVEDRNGDFTRNTRRMQRIAHVACRRKHSAADLIEEHMYDWELRFEHQPRETPGRNSSREKRRGKELSPMHLQTADMRMSWMKATNMDEVLVFIGVATFIFYAFNFLCSYRQNL
ncbi:glycosyltransferase family 1 protein [Nemania sp. FL0031]|nr:glycosyltransferase family 1 protein [Nemania sp. FL0031]